MRKPLLSFAAILCFAACGASADYDLVIANGRVMDPETQFDAIANIGIKAGVIEKISTDDLAGKQRIDASGLVVAPGFIDTHFHSVDRFATKLAVTDGITTGMDLEAGATRVGQWYDEKDTAGWQVNYGTTTSMLLTRILVHDPEVVVEEPLDASNGSAYINKAAEDGVDGFASTRSSIDDMNAILRLLDEDLRQGAIGLGVPAAYIQKGMSSYEQFAAQRVAARYGRLSSVHLRFHLNTETPNEAPISFSEVLANAMLLDAPLLLAHNNDYGWWEHEEKLKMARAKGYNVWSEYYPFAAGSTYIGAEFIKPEIWEDVNGYKYEETLYDPGQDKFLSKAEYLAIVKQNPGYFVVIHLPPRKEWLKYWPTVPHMVVASDAVMGVDKDGNFLPYNAPATDYAGHPRTVSSYSTTLAQAREQGVPLMFTLSQLSYWNAKHLGDTGLVAMQKRGRLQEGMIADITIFDADKVEPTATYKAGENGLPPKGIPYVIVNGTVVVDKGVVQDVRPGQPIRFPVESEPRFEPVDKNEWIDQHTLQSNPIPDMDDTGASQLGLSHN
jgi:cytosine/adenosine deaminase-related metal-dependent hydrolase